MATAAPACVAALVEATRLWPLRSTASDGILASPQHAAQNPTSDHSLGNAFDITHDPQSGVYAGVLAEMIKTRKDPRVKYVIWNRKIWNSSISLNWRPYTGDNPHTKHMHVSIHEWARNNVSQWWLIEENPVEEEMMPAVFARPQGGHVVLQKDGGVFAYSGAPFHGSVPGLGISTSVVSLAWTPSGNGYWVLGADGGVFSFGDAQYQGGFNQLSPEIRGNRKPIGIVARGSGYSIIAFDPGNDGSPYDHYNFPI